MAKRSQVATELGKALCDAMKINANEVYEMHLHFKVGEPVRVDLALFPDHPDEAPTLQGYRLVHEENADG